MRWLVQLYDRRIVNVNVNIVVAGLLALAITVGVMHTAEAMGLVQWLKGKVGTFQVNLPFWKATIDGDKLVVSGMTLVVDAVADIVVYCFLHWFANHMPRKRIPRVRPEYQELTFLRDATLVQFERAVLSPLLYLVALGLQAALLHEGWSVGPATGVGLAVGILVSRLLHTLWMLRQERRAGRRSAADIVGPDPRRGETATSGAGEAEVSGQRAEAEGRSRTQERTPVGSSRGE